MQRPSRDAGTPDGHVVAATWPPGLFYDLATDLSGDRRWLAVGALCSDDYDAGGPLAVWDVLRHAMVRRRTIAPGGIGLSGEGLLRFSASGRLLVACVDTNQVMMIDPASEQLATVGHLTLSMADSAPGTLMLPGETDLLTSGDHGIAIAPTSGDHDDHSPRVRWLGPSDVRFWRAVARADGVVVSADAEAIVAIELPSGRVRYTSHALAATAHSDFAFTSDGSLLAGGDFGSVGFVDASNGKLLATYAAAHEYIDSVAWDVHGRRTAVVRASARRNDPTPGDVTIFERLAPTYALPVQPRWRPWLAAPDLRSFQFSPDGDRAVVATRAGDVVVFELAAAPREIARRRLAPDPKEWLGLYWGAEDTIVAITSTELFFLDTACKLRARAPLGFRVRRDI
jgi:hypothetical protein